jgi:hypothetical protein
MFKITTTSTNALLTTVVKRAAYFLYCCWWKSSTGNFNFLLQVLQCSWLKYKLLFWDTLYTNNKILMLEVKIKNPELKFILSV